MPKTPCVKKWHIKKENENVMKNWHVRHVGQCEQNCYQLTKWTLDTRIPENVVKMLDIWHIWHAGHYVIKFKKRRRRKDKVNLAHKDTWEFCEDAGMVSMFCRTELFLTPSAMWCWNTSSRGCWVPHKTSHTHWRIKIKWCCPPTHANLCTQTHPSCHNDLKAVSSLTHPGTTTGGKRNARRTKLT